MTSNCNIEHSHYVITVRIVIPTRRTHRLLFHRISQKWNGTYLCCYYFHWTRLLTKKIVALFIRLLFVFYVLTGQVALYWLTKTFGTGLSRTVTSGLYSDWVCWFRLHVLLCCPRKSWSIVLDLSRWGFLSGKQVFKNSSHRLRESPLRREIQQNQRIINSKARNWIFQRYVYSCVHGLRIVVCYKR